MKKVNEYQVIDHGFDGEQYFQGCGLAFTEFEDIATGIGDTAREAFGDALESLAQQGWDVDGIPKGGHGFSRQTVKGYLKSLGASEADIEDNETWAYVSIRVR